MLIHGNNLDELPKLPDNSVDAIITDPPYELGFMGKTWDSTGIAYNVELWQQCLRVLKPGGHLLAFGGSRTYHRMAVAIEDAGFQIRDQIMWVYGSGFPKSLDVSKSIDKQAGAQREVTGMKVTGKARTDQGWQGGQQEVPVTAPATDPAKQWDGWGTALKPAHEPIVLARKPLDGTVAQNVLTHGVGGINIDGCRVGNESLQINHYNAKGYNPFFHDSQAGNPYVSSGHSGRFPANFIHDGSDEVLKLFPDTAGQSAARFFYCAKANKKDRNEGLDGFEEKRPDERSVTGMGTFEEKGVAKQANHHPTVKPTDLMRYLCRLITPPGGTILDPFTGSGSTGKAAVLEGFNFIGIELDPDYIAIAEARIQHAYNQRH